MTSVFAKVFLTQNSTSDPNNALADQYRALAAQEQNVIFGGRLAEYKYYDMAPIVEKVLGMEIK